MSGVNSKIMEFYIMRKQSCCRKLKTDNKLYTVWMKSMTILSVDMHLLHHYRSNFALLLDFQSSSHQTIEIVYMTNKNQKIKEQMQIYKMCTLFIFYEELYKFFIGPKVLFIGGFYFLRSNTFSDLFCQFRTIFF